ncbi:MAG: hypothetical protein LUI06_04400 [Ruminococcus sp.]|nr:hypothetical protein [Ruminococcus sp.]
MKIDMYKRYKLKDGRTGYTIESFDSGKAYMIELDDKSEEDWMPIVKKEDIVEQLN